MFIHVPSAWLAMFAYVLIAISGLGTLIWRHPLADVSAKAAAPSARRSFSHSSPRSLWGQAHVGHLLGLGRPCHLHAGIVPALSRADRALWQAIEEPGRAGRAAAILALVGAVNIPIIILGELVEHAPPAGQRDPRGRPTIDSSCSRRSSSWRWAFYGPLHSAALDRHASGDSTPPGSRPAANPGRTGGVDGSLGHPCSTLDLTPASSLPPMP